MNKNKAFTLVELMTTIAILAVLAGLVAPSMSSFLRKNNLSGAANNLYSAILLARAEAVKQKKNVTVSPVGASWADGWKVTVGGEKIGGFDGVADYITASSKGAKGAIVFNARGYTTTKNPWGASDGVKFCDGKGKAKKVILKTSGSVSVLDDTCG